MSAPSDIFVGQNNKIISHDKEDAARKPTIERRDILKMGLGGFLVAMSPFALSSSAHAYSKKRWEVSFHNAHTKQKFSGVYRVGDQYVPEAFDKISYILRDFRTGEVFPMDPRVIDVLSLVQKKTRSRNSFEILSGYRSPRTNAMLRKGTSGVAKNSYHMYGQALDIRLPGFNTRQLRNEAQKIRAGGVGYYARSNFVHVDTGDVRSW